MNLTQSVVSTGATKTLDSLENTQASGAAGSSDGRSSQTNYIAQNDSVVTSSLQLVSISIVTQFPCKFEVYMYFHWLRVTTASCRFTWLIGMPLRGRGFKTHTMWTCSLQLAEVSRRIPCEPAACSCNSMWKYTSHLQGNCVTIRLTSCKIFVTTGGACNNNSLHWDIVVLRYAITRSSSSFVKRSAMHRSTLPLARPACVFSSQERWPAQLPTSPYGHTV